MNNVITRVITNGTILDVESGSESACDGVSVNGTIVDVESGSESACDGVSVVVSVRKVHARTCLHNHVYVNEVNVINNSICKHYTLINYMYNYFFITSHGYFMSCNQFSSLI